jgi:hypothetical protein
MKLFTGILAFQLANAEFKHKRWHNKSVQKKAKSTMKARREQELVRKKNPETSRNIICGGEINDDAIITSPGSIEDTTT